MKDEDKAILGTLSNEKDMILGKKKDAYIQQVIQWRREMQG